MSDFVTTLGVMGGLAVVYVTGLNWMDPAVALLFSAWLFYTGFGLVKESVGGLMDNEDPELLDKIVGAMNQHRVPEIISVEAVGGLSRYVSPVKPYGEAFFVSQQLLHNSYRFRILFQKI